MAVQMIFCVETNKKADTDWIYLTEILRHKYVINNQIKITKVNMGTKSKYNSKEVMKEVQTKITDFVIGTSKVFYCIDTDSYESCYEQQKELEDIKKFCAKNGYELIWFCHDVEEVFLGKQVSDSQKTKAAADFRRKGMIANVDVAKLKAEHPRKNSSNILGVLDQYLQRNV